MSEPEIRMPLEVAEKLGFYVYIYVDPRTNRPFYVGKGQGARTLAHLSVQNESRKAQLLAQIRADGKEPRIDILTHGLPDEETAFRIEAAVIDALELADLTNEVRGWGTTIAGRAPLTELIASFAAKPVKITEPSLLIRINRLYKPDLTPHALYEATRGVWKLGIRRSSAKYAMPVFGGVVRAVYEIDSWHPAASTAYETRDTVSLKQPGRWEFLGRDAPAEIRSKYVGGLVTEYLPHGLQSPVVYVSCRK